MIFEKFFVRLVTETFAEIRVQFSEMWQSKDVTTEENFHRMVTLKMFTVIFINQQF